MIVGVVVVSTITIAVVRDGHQPRAEDAVQHVSLLEAALHVDPELKHQGSELSGRHCGKLAVVELWVSLFYNFHLLLGSNTRSWVGVDLGL